MKAAIFDLRRLYEAEKYSAVQIGVMYGVADVTIARWLREAGIAVRRYRTATDIRIRFAASYRVDDATGCWLWSKGVAGGRAKGRYGQMRMPDHSGKSAHRVSYELHHGSIPETMAVCHRCDTPLCVRPDHLFLGTVAENNADKRAKGRETPLEARPNAKLTWAIVETIRASSDDCSSLGRQFGISRGMAWRVKTHKSWRAAQAPSAPR